MYNNYNKSRFNTNKNSVLSSNFNNNEESLMYNYNSMYNNNNNNNYSINNSTALNIKDNSAVQTSLKKRKVILLGCPGVGKSAVILRFRDDVFRNDYIPTIQEIYKKEFKFNNENVELEILDLDGQNEYTLFSGNKFALGVHGYILCYSVENQYSFNLIKNINLKLSALVGEHVPKLLIGNKLDLNNKKIISTEKGKELAKEINATFIECSARTGHNIQLIFHSMLVEINKFESNIDLGTYTCSWLIRFVMRNIDNLAITTYILLILQIVSENLIKY